MGVPFRRNFKARWQPHSISLWVSKEPMLRLGLPFMLGLVVMSVVLTDMFATRIEWDTAQKNQMSEREELGLKRKSKFDIREEYFRLTQNIEENWENKRVPRLPGQAEWGDVGEGYREVPGSRWQPGMQPAQPPEVKL